MNYKKIVSIVIFLGLIFGCNFVFAEKVQLQNPISSNTIKELITKIAEGIAVLVIDLGAIMIVVAGILFLTSTGNTQRLETAKKAMIWAVIGLAIGLAAQQIIKIVEQIMGVTNT